MKSQICAIALLLLIADVSEAQVQYSVRDLGIPTTPEGDAYGGVNSSGIVAGSFALETGDRHAFVYDVTRSGFIDLGTLGGHTSRANSINSSATVVGRSSTSDRVTHAFRYSALTGIEDIHPRVSLGGPNSSALAIKDNGDILGWADTSSGQRHAFLYEPTTGVLTDLHTAAGLPTGSSGAYDMDQSGNVVGVFQNATGESHAFYYARSDGTFTDVGTLGGPGSALFRVKNGIAIGTADLNGTSWHAIEFQQANLFDLIGFGGDSTAFDINGSGQVVGAATNADSETRAFVYDHALGMRDLNGLITDPNWYLLEAQSINDRGQIAGTGSINGSLRVFLLTPAGADATPPSLSLPGNLTLDATSAAGAVAGYTATAVDDTDGPVLITCAPASGSIFRVGTTVVSCSATDAAGNVATGTFTVSLRANTSVQPIDVGTFSIGEVWAQLGGAFTYELAPGSTLPPGLAIRTETPPFFPPDVHAGVIGVATTPGTYAFTLLRSGVAVDYRIKISPLTVKDPFQLFDAFVNKPYSYQMTALNAAGQTTWTADASTLPPGVTMDAAGLLAGTPTRSGVYDVGFSVNDGVDTAFRTLRVPVYDVEITTNGSLPNAVQNLPYSTTVLAAGGAGGYTFTGGNLPSGLMLDAGGTITGTPAGGPAHWWFDVTATDANHASYTKTMSIDVLGVPPALPSVLPGGSSAFTNFFDDCSIGRACVLQAMAQNGGRAPFTWMADGLPPGMDVRSGSGATAWFVGPGNLELWGAPTATGTFPVRLAVTDLDGASAANTFDVRVSPLVEWSIFLVNGAAGAPYSHHFLVIGGRPPYSVSVVGGRLPLGLTLDAAALTVSGTPAESGNFSPTLEFRDADGVPLRVTNYLAIDAGASTLRVTSFDDVGTIRAGAFFSTQLSACCAASGFNWSVSTGSLPSGLALSQNGVLSGTPPSGTSGTFTFVVRVEDASNPANFALRQLTIAVTPLSVTTINLPVGNVGTPYTGFVAATGGTGITWTLEPFQYPPPGLTVHANGAIDGTPSSSGQYSFTLRAVDDAGDVLTHFFFNISIYPAGVIVRGDLSATVVDFEDVADSVPFYQPFPASYHGITWTGWYHYAPYGAPYQPHGVNAVFSLGDAASFSFPEQMFVGASFSRNPTYPGRVYFELYDRRQLVWTSSDLADLPPQRTFLPSGFAGLVDEVRVRSTTGAGGWLIDDVTFAAPNANDLGTFSIGEVWAQLGGPYTYDLAPGSTLPPGLAIRTETPPFFPPDVHAGVIGVATAPGTYTFTLLRSGVPVDYRIKISPLTVKDPFELFDAFVNRPYSYRLTALDAAGPATWTADPTTLSPGVTLDPSGLMSGTPTRAGVYDVSFTVNDGVDTAFRTVRVSVFDIEITTNGSLPNATQSVPYSTTILAAGGAGGYTFTGDNLPPGLAISDTGTIFGTVLFFTGHWWFNVTATDANHSSYTKTMSIDVIGVPPALPTVIPGGSTPQTNFFDDCSIGRACTLQVMVLNGGRAPFTWTAAGLPPGMDVRSGSGETSRFIGPENLELWGTPTSVGTYRATLTVRDADGQSATNTFDVRVSPITEWNFLTGGTAGVPYSHHFLVIGGRPGYTSAIVAGRLPLGLTLDPAALTVSGTPIESGNFSPTLEFRDADGALLRVRNYFTIGSGTSTLTVTMNDDLGTIDAGAFYSTRLFACCASAYAWSADAVSLPPGLSLSSDGVLSGTPPPGTSGTFTFVVRVEDAIDPANVAVRQFTIAVTPLSVTTINLPVGNVGTPYNGSVAATGGPGITWTLEPFQYPPPGLTVHANGAIDGTPSSSGQYSFALRAADNAGDVLTRFFNISIYPASVAPPLDLRIGPNFDVPVGQFTIELQTTGGTPPYEYSYTPGAPEIPGTRVQNGQPLPTFFSPSATAGLLGVIPTPGTYQTSIRVTDSTGQFVDRAVTVRTSLLQVLSQNALPHATVGVPYAFTLTPFGGTSYTWSASNLPPGLSVDSSGVISGTPSSAGAFNPTIVVTDGPTSTSTTAFLGLNVDPFAITTDGALPQATVGAFYSQTFAAPGCIGTCIATFVAGSLPPGLSVANGTLSGTPTGTGNSAFAVEVAGTNGAVRKGFFLQIAAATPQPLTIVNGSIADVTVGGPIAVGLFAQGGVPPYRWSVRPAAGGGEALPPGVSLQGPGETLGYFLSAGITYLAGRAMQAGQFPLTLVVTDANGVIAERSFTWNVSELLWQYFTLPIAGHPLVYNSAYAQPLLVIGGSGAYTFAAGAMPEGLAVNPATGVIGGTPTNTISLNTTVRATDAGGHSFTAFVTINVAAPTAKTIGFAGGTNLGTALRGSVSSSNVVPIGGTAPYTITPLTPLPPGFVLNPISGAGIPAGAVSVFGLALSPGAYSFTLEARDADGNIGVRTFSLTVAAFATLNTVLSDASVGVPYSQTLFTFGTATWALAAGSTPPPGMTASSNGVISGTPTTPGTFPFVLVESDGTSSVTLSFTLRVSSIAIADSQILPVAIVGAPYTFTFTSTGSGATKMWSATGLPPGLAISTDGSILGTPGSAGNFPVVVTATDGGVPIVRRFTLFVRNPNPSVLNVPLTNTTIADFVVGQPGSFRLRVDGGVPPYAWATAPGSALPPGLTLLSRGSLPATANPGNTLLAGSPTAAGLYTFDLVVTDSAGTRLRRTYTLNVSSIGIVSATLPNAVTGTRYVARIIAAGGAAPFTITMTPVDPLVDMLPPGLTLSADGTVDGTPTSSGTYAFIVHVVDSGGVTFSRVVDLTAASPSGLVITGQNAADTSIGRGRSVQLLTAQPLAGVASTYTWSLVGGALPPGMRVTSGAELFGPNTTIVGGQPTASGTFVYTLRATNTVNTSDFADHVFTIHVAAFQVVSPPVGFMIAADLPGGHVGEPYSTAIKLAGATPPYAFSVAPLNRLPPGLTLTTDGTLSGIPQEIGAFAFTLLASDASASPIATSFELVVTQLGVPSPLIPATTLGSPVVIDDATAGVPYLYPLDLLVRGGLPPFRWEIAPGSILPPGLSILGGDATMPAYLAGIPSVAPNRSSFELTVTDGANETLQIPLLVFSAPVGLHQLSLPPGVVGRPYSTSLLPTGGAPPYSVRLFAKSDFPAGLTLSDSGDFSGTPLSAGYFRVNVVIEDGSGSSAVRSYRLTIDNALGEAPGIALSPNPIVVSYLAGATAQVHVPLSVTSTSGARAFTVAVAGAPWAAIDATSATTPSTVAVAVDVASLSAGTYFGLIGVTDAATNREEVAPVLVTIAAGPTVTLGATTGTAGGRVTATIANAPPTPGDWVGLYDANGIPVQWQYLNGTHTLPTTSITSATVTFILPATPGTYHARLFNAAYTLIATSGTITTTAPTVTLGSATGTAGGPVTAIITNAPGTPGDWVGLYDAAGVPVQWRYLNGTQTLPTVGITSATITFTLPATPGTYHARLFNATYSLVATSGTITTTAPTVTLGAATGAAGGPVTATIVNAPGTPGDWVGLYDANGIPVQWQYLNGTHTLPGTGVTSATVTFTLPATPGTYHARLFNATYTLIATSGTITTTAPTVTLGASTGTAGGTVTATIANAPGTPGDWVGLYDANGVPLQWQYLSGTHTLPATGVTSATVTFTVPAAPGTYHVRLFNGIYVLVATSGMIAVF